MNENEVSIMTPEDKREETKVVYSEQLKELLNNNSNLEKLVLAHWLSIPSDNKTCPRKIKIYRTQKDRVNYWLVNRNNLEYGIGSAFFKDLERYLERANEYFKDQEEIKEFDANADNMDDESEFCLQQSKEAQLDAQTELLELNEEYKNRGDLE